MAIRCETNVVVESQRKTRWGTFDLNKALSSHFGGAEGAPILHGVVITVSSQKWLLLTHFYRLYFSFSVQVHTYWIIEKCSKIIAV